MRELDFPDAEVLDYPGQLGAPRLKSELFLVTPPISVGDDLLDIPGGTHEEAVELLDVLSNVPGLAGSAIGTNRVGWFIDRLDLAGIRTDYLNGVDEIYKHWLDNDQVINQPMAHKLSEMRNQVKLRSRKASGIPLKAYQVVDTVKARYRQLRGKSTVQQMFENQKWEEIIRGSFKANPRLNREWVKATQNMSKFVRPLGPIGTVVGAVDIAAPIADLYNAGTDEEKNNALKKLGNVTGDVGGSALGSVSGAALCIALGVATGGLGFIGCGIVGGVAGGVLGRSAADAVANQFVD